LKSLSNVVSANKVDARGWDGGEFGIRCSLERHSMIYEILTCVIVRHRRTLNTKQVLYCGSSYCPTKFSCLLDLASRTSECLLVTIVESCVRNG
jgi:hypothetical protein